MALTTTFSNHYKYQLGKKQIDLSLDDLIILLMDSSFTFDPDTHATISDVADHQLATLNGYTQSNKALSSLSWVENDTLNKAVFSCADVTWAATTDDDATGIGPFGSYVVVDKSAMEATELITNAVDRNFTGGSSNWANVDLGGSFNDTDDLSLVATATGQYCKISFTDIGTALVAGGLYRLQYDFTESVAGYEFKINGVAEQTLGDAVAGTSQYIDFFADEAFTGTHELRIYSKTGAAAAGDFDNFSLKEAGTVIQCIDYGTDHTINSPSSVQIQNINLNHE